MTTTTANRVSLETIENALRKMKVGHIGTKWDCLVWRIADDVFAVGEQSVSRDDTLSLEAAAVFVRACN